MLLVDDLVDSRWTLTVVVSALLKAGSGPVSATDETKSRYPLVYGDFRRLHRIGLIACQYRAAEWCHKDVELSARDLLQRLDAASARDPSSLREAGGVSDSLVPRSFAKNFA